MHTGTENRGQSSGAWPTHGMRCSGQDPPDSRTLPAPAGGAPRRECVLRVRTACREIEFRDEVKAAIKDYGRIARFAPGGAARRSPPPRAGAGAHPHTATGSQARDRGQQEKKKRSRLGGARAAAVLRRGTPAVDADLRRPPLEPPRGLAIYNSGRKAGPKQGVLLAWSTIRRSPARRGGGSVCSPHSGGSAEAAPEEPVHSVCLQRPKPAQSQRQPSLAVRSAVALWHVCRFDCSGIAFVVHAHVVPAGPVATEQLRLVGPLPIGVIPVVELAAVDHRHSLTFGPEVGHGLRTLGNVARCAGLRTADVVAEVAVTAELGFLELLAIVEFAPVHNLRIGVAKHRGRSRLIGPEAPVRDLHVVEAPTV
eukprot:scaffold22805_cov59-Phaeocystis_antarctica.AAC.16